MAAGKIIPKNAKVVVSDMSEMGTSRTVANGKNVSRGCLHSLVDFHEPTLGESDPG
jgi:hypothetical protein